MEMKTGNLVTIVASVLAFSISLPAGGAEKVTGVNKDLQVLSEVDAVVPDKPNHSVKQLTEIWNSTSSSAEMANYWCSAVEQQDVIGNEITSKGYGTGHFANGDVTYFSWEGTGKLTPKDGGAFEIISQGKFAWTGGTGKYKLTGPGTYSCKITPAGAHCDWQGEPAPSSM
jgi:hypothetical protein